MKPLINWVGGKTRLAKHILPLFPAHRCYVEPFCGGAALFFAKERSEVEVINDINSDLINLYRVTRLHHDELQRLLNQTIKSRQLFNETVAQDTRTLTDIQRAARFFYILRNNFGGMIKSEDYGYGTMRGGATTSVTFSQENETTLKNVSERLSARGVNIENKDWRDIIKRYDRPHTLFFLDPPYFETAGYGSEFEYSEYVELAKMLKKIKGKFILTINNHEKMIELFNQFQRKDVAIKYTLASKKTGAESKELIFANFKINED